LTLIDFISVESETITAGIVSPNLNDEEQCYHTKIIFNVT
jgi:hypothetical protein